jgi:hypothetical protein
MTDYELRDIGLTRSGIEAAVCRGDVDPAEARAQPRGLSGQEKPGCGPGLSASYRDISCTGIDATKAG